MILLFFYYKNNYSKFYNLSITSRRPIFFYFLFTYTCVASEKKVAIIDAAVMGMVMEFAYSKLAVLSSRPLLWESCVGIKQMERPQHRVLQA